MKRALVLCGGGSKGAFQVGVVRQLERAGLTFDYISGVSVGAINGLYVALNKTEELEKEWFGIKGFDDIFETNYCSFTASCFFSGFTPSIYEPGPMLKRVRETAMTSTPVMPFEVGVTDLVSGKYKSINCTTPNFHEYVIASCSIPLILPPVKVNGGMYVDGSVRNNTPLSEAVDAGADDIYIVLTEPRTPKVKENVKYNSPLQVALRTIEIVANDFYIEDIKVCLLKNKIDGYRKIDLHIYEPKEDLGFLLDFSPKRIAKNHALAASCREDHPTYVANNG